MRGIIRNPKMVVMGSALCRVGRVNSREMSQCKRQGLQRRMDSGKTGSEENRHNTKNQDDVTEHPGGAGGQAGDGTLSATVR